MYDKFLSLLLRLIRTKFNMTQKELGVLIEKSEVAVRKYESGTIKIPFYVLFMTVHEVGLTATNLIHFVQNVSEQITKENIMSDSDLDKCLEKIYMDTRRIFKGFIYSADLDCVDSVEFINILLDNQIQEYIERIINHKNRKSSGLTLVTEEKTEYIRQEVINYLNYKIDEYYKNNTSFIISE